MHKELIFKDIYEANLKGKASNEARFYRIARTAKEYQMVQSSISSKRSLNFKIIAIILFCCPLAYAAYQGSQLIWIEQPKSIERFEQPFVLTGYTPLLTPYSIEDSIQTESGQVNPFFPQVDQAVEPMDYLSWSQNQDITIARLLGLGVKTIVIDPGHGGKDPGAIGPTGLKEKNVTMALAQLLKSKLQQHHYRVLLTHDKDVTMSLKERVRFANDNDADLFISLHINSLPVKEPTVVETYFFGPQSDESAKTSAERENHGSDYSMGEFRQMISRIGDSLKQQESKNLAQSIQQNLYRSLKQQRRPVSSWGIKTAPFVILLGVDMPSVLAEVTTLSNEEEEEKLKTESYREKISSYLELGITSYLDQVNVNFQDRLIGSKEDGSKTAGNS